MERSGFVRCSKGPKRQPILDKNRIEVRGYDHPVAELLASVFLKYVGGVEAEDFYSQHAKKKKPYLAATFPAKREFHSFLQRSLMHQAMLIVLNPVNAA
jgi:hypothetical protein